MSVPRDVVVARGVRALQRGLILTMGAVLVLAVFAAAIALLAADGPSSVWPGLTALLAGQLGALVAGVLALLGIRAALGPAADVPRIRERTAQQMGRVVRPLVALLVAVVAAWTLVSPRAGMEALVLALVAAQAVAAIRLGATAVATDRP